MRLPPGRPATLDPHPPELPEGRRAGDGMARGTPEGGTGGAPTRSVAAKDVLGRRGEDLAAEHLTARGAVVLDRNWRRREGELDLVAQDGARLLVVEVKTRSAPVSGSPPRR